MGRLDSSCNSVLVKSVWMKKKEKRNLLFNTFFEGGKKKCRGSVIYFLLFVHGCVLSLPVGYCCSLFQITAAVPLTSLYACDHQCHLSYCSVCVGEPIRGCPAVCSRGSLCAVPGSPSLLTASVVCVRCLQTGLLDTTHGRAFWMQKVFNPVPNLLAQRQVHTSLPSCTLRIMSTNSVFIDIVQLSVLCSGTVSWIITRLNIVFMHIFFSFWSKDKIV